MRILRTIPEVRAAIREARGANKTIGLVPTMGAFHDGHLSLMRAARAASDLVVVSLFVNPTQFGANEDLSAYPRDEDRDAALAEAEAVDILFAPAAAEIYPDGFATNIHVDGLTDVLDGASRGAHHFDGVATVVTKLFGIVRPDAAYFGQKDAQQVLVVRRVVRDLDLDVRIVACPIVREADGLAMSSRNVYLDLEARARATALNRALEAAAVVFDAGEREADSILSAARSVLDDAGIGPEYLELRDAETLQPVTRIEADALLAVAAHVGAARLIDNHVFSVTDASVADASVPDASVPDANPHDPKGDV
ncbi:MULTISPECIES: pantoate--beta-alanine ligase [unclassified Microbacterium]|uniref:pantoate--beta-alanine ligase n=1 Tax=unclassified Microbacterium TaxID=2609290 RepID=UPI000CFE1BCF|nr:MULTISPECIES: pantoate--beta-alanine ligase [unclassified Microbacterium]PQZ54352.1 pantoate--beta-alanine ligase [Microbacterium sp. MYb43]PQZ70681.1 pantoate--beta-alanine ligase [Microbacterium sp. MYb40]PRB19590.1 pantoate--beta-alanine ligase [Microbacterium sp. MYb54]PRB25721.1 pantoate--beta-alanine ligase [Microbacterium sp. MYb50]PRB64204.1 pantoate--beta-alanine ligase [Microbacterium sp. MYb24]